ncbi:MAG TPA: hypothetical protein PLK02_07400 [Paludibacteraceae bacterium]|nr:hypothetical protein [Paludibacteraceae bacterium]
MKTKYIIVIAVVSIMLLVFAILGIIRQREVKKLSSMVKHMKELHIADSVLQVHYVKERAILFDSVNYHKQKASELYTAYKKNDKAWRERYAKLVNSSQVIPDTCKEFTTPLINGLIECKGKNDTLNIIVNKQSEIIFDLETVTYNDSIRVNQLLDYQKQADNLIQKQQNEIAKHPTFWEKNNFVIGVGVGFLTGIGFLALLSK